MRTNTTPLSIIVALYFVALTIHYTAAPAPAADTRTRIGNGVKVQETDNRPEKRRTYIEKKNREGEVIAMIPLDVEDYTTVTTETTVGGHYEKARPVYLYTPADSYISLKDYRMLTNEARRALNQKYRRVPYYEHVGEYQNGAFTGKGGALHLVGYELKGLPVYAWKVEKGTRPARNSQRTRRTK